MSGGRRSLPESIRAAQSTGRRTFDGFTLSGGLDISVGAGSGVIKVGPPEDPEPSQTLFIKWSQATLSVPANTTQTIAVQSNGVVSLFSGNAPDPETHILLGLVRSNATDIVFVSHYDLDIIQKVADRFSYLNSTTGSVVSSGMALSKAAPTSRQLAVATGSYYIAEDLKTLSAPINPVTFTYWHDNGSGGWTAVTSQTQIDNSQYDNGGLVSLPAGQFRKDRVFIAPLSNTAHAVHVVYGRNAYDNKQMAEVSTETQAPPEFRVFSVLLGSVVIQSGSSDIASVLDERRSRTVFTNGEGKIPNSRLNLQQALTLFFYSDATSGPFGGQNVTINNTVVGIELKDGTDEGAATTTLIPKPGNLTTNPTLRFDLVVFKTGAGNANVEMRLTVRYVKDGENVDKAVDETQTFTVPVTNTLFRRHRVERPLDKSLIQAVDMIAIRIQRLGNTGPNDTFTGDMMIVKQGDLELGL